MSAEWPMARDQSGLVPEDEEETTPIAEGLYTLASRERRRKWGLRILALLLGLAALLMGQALDG